MLLSFRLEDNQVMDAGPCASSTKVADHFANYTQKISAEGGFACRSAATARAAPTSRRTWC